ncbi:MAG TPA: hypothetical protein VMG41_06485 [Gemmatimonadales bacterium]|nr:hypothetical protein [Gemmatimonadales bacterium]
MARELKFWALAVAVACGAVLAFSTRRPHRAGFRPPPEAATPTLLREQANEAWRRWQAAALELRLAGYRARLEPELEARAAHDLPSIAVLVDAPDSTALLARPIVQAAFDSAWRRLGLGVTKVSVGVIAVLRPERATGESEAGWLSATSYLFPDSTDRATCLVLLPAHAGAVLRNGNRSSGWYASWLLERLGPCAFYARFGVPGLRIRRWLAGHGYELAATPERWNWAEMPDTAGAVPEYPTREMWWRGGVYTLTLGALACFGGRASACRRAVTDNGTLARDSIPRLVSNPYYVPLDRRRLLGSGSFLAAVARSVGPDRFQELWTTELPVDSALSLALREPVGEWTARWQRTIGPAPALTPTPPFAETLAAMLSVVACLGIATLGAARRRVG